MDSLYVRHDRPSTRRQDKLVVGFPILGAVIEPAHEHLFRGDVYEERLVANAHVYVEALAEALRGLQGKLRAIRYHAAHVVWQSTVGIAHVVGTLKDDDLGLLVQTAQPSRRRRATRNPSDDDELHGIIPSPRDPTD